MTNRLTDIDVSDAVDLFVATGGEKLQMDNQTSMQHVVLPGMEKPINWLACTKTSESMRCTIQRPLGQSQMYE